MTDARVVELDDDDEIARFLARDPIRYVYAIGDLAPAFRQRATYVGLRGADGLRAVALRYDGLRLPGWQWVGTDTEALDRIVAALEPDLAPAFHLHVSLGVRHTLDGYSAEPHGRYLRMALAEPMAIERADTAGVRVVGDEENAELATFYDRAFPGHWHDAATLAHGVTTCWRDEAGTIRAAAGVHVVDPERGVAAIGNVAVEPAWRGRGLGQRVTAATAARLLALAPTVALNVAASNVPAVRLYERLGFRVHCQHDELTLRRSG